MATGRENDPPDLGQPSLTFEFGIRAGWSLGHASGS